jgi:hypothetical protein
VHSEQAFVETSIAPHDATKQRATGDIRLGVVDLDYLDGTIPDIQCHTLPCLISLTGLNNQGIVLQVLEVGRDRFTDA